MFLGQNIGLLKLFKIKIIIKIIKIWGTVNKFFQAVLRSWSRSEPRFFSVESEPIAAFLPRAGADKKNSGAREKWLGSATLLVGVREMRGVEGGEAVLEEMVKWRR